MLVYLVSDHLKENPWQVRVTTYGASAFSAFTRGRLLQIIDSDFPDMRPHALQMYQTPRGTST